MPFNIQFAFQCNSNSHTTTSKPKVSHKKMAGSVRRFIAKFAGKNKDKGLTLEQFEAEVIAPCTTEICRIESEDSLEIRKRRVSRERRRESLLIQEQAQAQASLTA